MDLLPVLCHPFATRVVPCHCCQCFVLSPCVVPCHCYQSCAMPLLPVLCHAIAVCYQGFAIPLLPELCHWACAVHLDAPASAGRWMRKTLCCMLGGVYVSS